MNIREESADILIIGGGAAGCYAAITLGEEHPGLSVVLVDKANIKRSGCLAAGVNALNAYITKGHTPQDYADYAKADAAGIVREDLLLSMSEGLNEVTAKLEKLGLVIQKNPDGSYASRGWRNIKINGENIKPILAKAVLDQSNVKVRNHINVIDYIVVDGQIRGAWGIDLNKEEIVVFTVRAVICATGGAAGLYQPNHPGTSRHKMWYSPFNTGAGYAMGLRAGAEMTTFEMRFIALRCKGTIAPTGTIAQGVGAPQVNSRGEEYQEKYGNTTAERLWAVVKENLAGHGPCYLGTHGISWEQAAALERAYLNMAPAQTLFWRESGLNPSEFDVEIEGSEPYVVGGHTASGYWIGVDRATTLPGLFAAGDVAGGCPQKYVTGSFVEGELAARSAAKFAQGPAPNFDSSRIKEKIIRQVQQFLGQVSDSPYTVESLEEAMQQAMDEYAGGIKTHYAYSESSLQIARKHIERLTQLSEHLKAQDFYGLLKIFELRERLLVCQALIEHLAARKETRWHAFAEHLDYPERREDYKVFINSRLEQGQIKIIRRSLAAGKEEAVV